MVKQLKDLQDEDELEPKYKAPALEKGLDILELLARHAKPMTSSEIATGLGRSVSELFRMILTLESRGYIAQVADGYALSNKLFTLGLAQGSVKNLLEVALPFMKELSIELGQSCHLVVPSGDQMVVVARQESPMDLGFSVRVGYRRRLIETNSGALYFGLVAADIRESWFAQLSVGASREDLERFQSKVDSGLEQGYIIRPSDFVDGVMDFCVPIETLQGPVAVLIVPFIHIKAQTLSEEKTLESLRRTTEKIAHDLLD